MSTAKLEISQVVSVSSCGKKKKMAKNERYSFVKDETKCKLAGYAIILFNTMRCTLIDLASVRKVVENQR